MKKNTVSAESKYDETGCVKVSLIVPMYLCENYVDRLLDNLCSQDFHDIEIICVVDGSPDRTYELAREYAKKDPRIRIFNQEHKGAGAARNFGLSRAQGEYLMFPDADDTYSVSYVSTLLSAIEKTRADIGVCQVSIKDFAVNSTRIFCGYSCIFYPKKKSVSPRSIAHCIYAIGHMPYNKIFRKDLITANNLRFMETQSINDVFLCSSAIICADSIVLVEEHLVTYNMYHNPGSISSRRGSFARDIVSVYMHLYEWMRDLQRDDGLLHDFYLKWSKDLSSYARHSEVKELVEIVSEAFVSLCPWKKMNGSQLRQKSQLYCSIAEHKLKSIRKRLRHDKLSPEMRVSLERQFEYAKREKEFYSELIRTLCKDYGKDMRGPDNYLVARLNQVRQVGLIGTLQIACGKILNRIRKVK